MRLSLNVIVRKAFEAGQLEQRTASGVASELAKSAHRIERAAKRRAPVAFGELRSLIGAVGPKRLGQAAVWEIGTRNAIYPQFIEFGTGPAGASSPLMPEARQAMADLGYAHGPGNFFPPMAAIKQWAAKRGLPDDAVWVVARAIGRRGIPAHPFLFPSYIEEKDALVGRIASVVKETR